MKKIFIATLILIASTTQAQNWEWVKLIQPADNLSGVRVQVSPVDGKLYAGGGFNQSIDLGNSHTLTGNNDGLLAQFDTAGLCQWAQRVYVTTQGCGCGVQGNTSGSGVVGFDSGGNLIVAGSFCGCGATFDGSTTSSASGYNLFIAKYNSSGVCQWVKTKPGSFNSSTGQTTDQINAVTIDAADNIYLSILSYATSTTFCGLNFATAGEYLCKINTNGVGIWNKQTANTTTGYGVIQMQYFNKRIYAAAQYGGTVAFGTYTLTSQSSIDVATLKMDTAGTYLAASDVGSSGGQAGVTALAISNNRVVLLGQSFSSSIIAGSYTVNTNTSKDKTFLVTYDTTSLTPQATRNTATDSLGSGSGLYSDLKGNMYLLTNNVATTGFGNLSSVPAGRHIIRMDNTLTNYWYSQSVGTWVAPDTLGNVYIIDDFTSSASYGSSLSETSSGYAITLGKIHNAWATGGIENRMANSNTMQVYPNPSTGLFNLKLGTNIKNNNAKIMLYDINGRLIADNLSFTKEDESTLQIDLTKYVEGSYIIKAEVDNVLYSAKLER